MIKNYVFGLLALLSVSACMQSDEFIKYSETVYKPTTSIELLRSKPFNRDYITIGELKFRITHQSKNAPLKEIKAKAKKIGADAIIILGQNQINKKHKSIQENYAQNPAYTNSSNMHYMTVLAIKYMSPAKADTKKSGMF